MTNGTIFKLKNEIQYETGKPVVKKLLDEETYKLFLIALEKADLPEHPAPLNALVTILSGEGTIVYDGKKFHVEKGDNFLFAKGVMHSVHAHKKMKLSLYLTEKSLAEEAE